jgi:hypothetical protein
LEKKWPEEKCECEQPKKIDRGTVQGEEPDEKNATHHPMDRKANWCSGGLLLLSAPEIWG